MFPGLLGVRSHFRLGSVKKGWVTCGCLSLPIQNGAVFSHRWEPGFCENLQDPFVANFSLFLNSSAAAPCLAVGAPGSAALWGDAGPAPCPAQPVPAGSDQFRLVPAAPPQGTAVYSVYTELTKSVTFEVLLINSFFFLLKLLISPILER